MGKCGSVQCGCFHFFPRVYSGKKKKFSLVILGVRRDGATGGLRLSI